MLWKVLDQQLIAKAIYPFTKDISHGLPLRIGDTLIITSKCEDWCYGYCILKSTTKSNSGIFPTNHIRIIGKNSSLSTDKRLSNDYSTDEIKSSMMTTIYVQLSLLLSSISKVVENNDDSKFIECEIYFNKLIELFYEIANWSVNREELIKLESNFSNISKINNVLGCDVAIRLKPFMVTSVVDLPLMQLYKLHRENMHIVNDYRVSDENKSDISPSVSNLTNYCLQIVVENFEFIGVSDDILLQWMIVDILNDTNYETFWQLIRETKKGRPSWMGEKFIYTNLSEDITKENFYLVVYVFRIGQLLPDPNKPVTTRFRRPLAFGSVRVKDLSSTSEKTVIILHSLNEIDFIKSPKEILRIKHGIPGQYRLVQLSTTLVDWNRIGFDVTDESHILRSLVLNDERPYEYDRNSLYLKLDSAEFEKANKATPRNVEAQILILNEKGSKMPCFCSNPDKDNKTEYLSHVTYHCNSPRWKDIIKIDLEKLKYDDCHIMINLYHCSTKDKRNDERKYFASSFLKLSEFLESGVSKMSFILNIQKLSESVKQHPKHYLLKSLSVQLDTEKTPSKEFCKIELLLCSTCTSNNKNINNFLNMKFDANVSTLSIRECLMEIQSIKNEDFLKPQLRRKIMNILKTLIIDKVYNFDSRIETDLFITWQALSNKYIHFQITTELISYLNGNFGILECLLKGLQYVLSTVAYSDISFDIINIVLNNMQPIFEVLSTINETDYQYDISQRLKEILRWFLFFFEGDYFPDSSNDIRILIFRFTIDNLKNIYKLLSIDIILDYFNCFFDSTDFKNRKILIKEKLDFFHNLLTSDNYTECFDILVICFVPTVEICLMHIDIGSPHILTATEVMLLLFKQYKNLSQDDRIDLISQPFMKTLFTQSFNVFTIKYYSDIEKQKYSAFDKDPENPKFIQVNNVETKISVECQKLCTLIVAYLEEWVEISNANITLKEFDIVLINIRMILEKNIYPKTWLSMHLKISCIFGNILKKISNCFENHNEEAYETLTLSYFDACFTFIMQSSLQLQNFPFAKSQAILEKYGDMRIDIMDCFLNVWRNKPSKLECFGKEFIVQVTRKVLNISFIQTPAIRCKTIPLLVHTITNWLDKCEDIKEVLNDLISETELLLRDGRCDETYYDTLIQILKLKRMPNDVEEIIECFATIINLHLEYRKISSQSNNILHIQFLFYAFMKFYQEKVGIFVHFQHYNNKFSQIIESEEHYFEAALILKQQYDCIHWGSEELMFDNIFYKNYDGIGNELLKEQLGKRIIELLNQAKEYEYAAELCQEIHCHYLNEYKYKELNPLLKQWARYYELIMTEVRLMLNYYRVTFIGGTLPSYMRQNQDYIVKGSMWFKTSTITSMLQNAFPDAKIKVYQSTPPTELQTDSSLTIYLAKMEPIPSDLDFIKNNNISFKIRSFYKDHKVNCFFSDHPFHKGVIDKTNEVKSLHISRVIVLTNMMMPNEFMWNPIIHEEREIFTPIDVAIETVEKKNIVIREMMQELEENSLKDLRPFTMLLTGTLDAGVNGGMPKYIEAFFSESYDGIKDINLDLLNCFRNVLLEQKNVLNEALALHKKLAPPPILPMHERLEECFGYLKKSIIDLDVTRKRSFSNMRSLDDIYAHIHELIKKGSSEMEQSILEEREAIQMRNTFVSNGTSLSNLREQTFGSSYCSSKSRNHLSSMARSVFSSQSESEMDKCRLTPVSQRRRLSSSNNESMIEEMAHKYVMQQMSMVLNPSLSEPDIQRPLSKSMSLNDSKTPLMKSPPLPPREEPSLELPISNAPEEHTTSCQSKSLKSSIWKTLISRGKEIKSSNGKLSFETRGKTKTNVVDMFKNTEI